MRGLILGVLLVGSVACGTEEGATGDGTGGGTIGGTLGGADIPAIDTPVEKAPTAAPTATSTTTDGMPTKPWTYDAPTTTEATSTSAETSTAPATTTTTGATTLARESLSSCAPAPEMPEIKLPPPGEDFVPPHPTLILYRRMLFEVYNSLKSRGIMLCKEVSMEVRETNAMPFQDAKMREIAGVVIVQDPVAPKIILNGNLHYREYTVTRKFIVSAILNVYIYASLPAEKMIGLAAEDDRGIYRITPEDFDNAVAKASPYSEWLEYYNFIRKVPPTTPTYTMRLWRN